MRASRTSGSVRGAGSNSRPYSTGFGASLACVFFALGRCRLSIPDRVQSPPYPRGVEPAAAPPNRDKSLVGAAVEKVPAPKNRSGKHGHAVKRQQAFFAGDARIAVLPAATGTELGAFLKANVAADSHLLTDGFVGCRGADLGEYLKHTSVVQGDGTNAGQFFPIIHTLFSTSKPGWSALITGSAPSTSRATCANGPTGTIAATGPPVWIDI